MQRKKKKKKKKNIKGKQSHAAGGGSEREAEDWASATTTALLQRLSKGKGKKEANAAKASKEALARSAALSTSSDAKGVSFRGTAFQELYLRTKWNRRFLLVFRFFATVMARSGSSLLAQELIKLARNAPPVSIACWGGGPANDGAGAALAFEKLVFPAAEQAWVGAARVGPAAAAEEEAAAAAAAAAVVAAATAAAAAAAAVVAVAAAATAAAASTVATEESASAAAAAAAAATAGAARVGPADAAEEEAAAAVAAVVAAAAAAAAVAAAVEATAAAAAASAVATEETASAAAAAAATAAEAAATTATDAAAAAAAAAISVSVTVLDKEKTWVRLISTLQERLSQQTELRFVHSDITERRSLCYNPSFAAFRWHKEDAVLSRANVHIFSYVVHETSDACKKSGHEFFRRLAVGARDGAIFLFFDIMGERGEAAVSCAMAAMREALVEDGTSRREMRSLGLPGTDLRSSVSAAHIVAMA